MKDNIKKKLIEFAEVLTLAFITFNVIFFFNVNIYFGLGAFVIFLVFMWQLLSRKNGIS